MENYETNPFTSIFRLSLSIFIQFHAETEVSRNPCIRFLRNEPIPSWERTG